MNADLTTEDWNKIQMLKTYLKLFVSACILLCTQSCSNIFYLPSNQIVMTPKDIGITYEDIWIETPNEPKLHAWYLPAKEPIATVLFLHGNAENISTHFQSVYWMPSQGLSVLLLDYRGYGLSEGSVSIDGIHRDIERATEFLVQQKASPDEKLVLFGQSLGASMALFSAAQPKLHGAFSLVVAESAFSGYRYIAQEKLASTWLSYPFQWILPYLINDSYSPSEVIEKIFPTPVLLIHGSADPVVDAKNSDLLCEKLQSACHIWKLPEGNHIAAFSDKKLQTDLLSIIRSGF